MTFLLGAWFGCGADALAVRADRKPWLVVMPLERLLELVRDEEASA